MDDFIYSKYLVPKDKAEVQRFDCPDSEYRYEMRPQYEEFVRELAHKLYGTPYGFYLSFEDVVEVSGAK